MAAAGLTLLAAGFAVGVAAQGPVSSQYPIFNQDDFVRTMKTVGQNFAAVSPAIASGDVENAKARAIRAREQLATTVTFWRKNKRGDAVAMLRTATARLDELDTALSRTPVDRAAAAAAAEQAAGVCQACHAQYREQDPATRTYRIKASALQ